MALWSSVHMLKVLVLIPELAVWKVCVLAHFQTWATGDACARASPCRLTFRGDCMAIMNP